MKEQLPISYFQGNYRFLSNFWPCRIEFEGLVYPSVEHTYQASKTQDDEARARILVARTPGDAKRAGKRVKLRSGWDSIKVAVMTDLVFRKFQDPGLAEKLKATGERPLVEGNTWGDVFWGVYNGRGENHLGKILMRVRKELQK